MGRVDQHVGTAARFAESLVAFRCGKQVSAFIDAPAILWFWSATYVMCYAEFAREWKISRSRYVPVRRNFVIFSVLSVFQKSISSAFSIRSETQADSITRSNETEISMRSKSLKELTPLVPRPIVRALFWGNLIVAACVSS